MPDERTFDPLSEADLEEEREQLDEEVRKVVARETGDAPDLA